MVPGHAHAVRMRTVRHDDLAGVAVVPVVAAVAVAQCAASQVPATDVEELAIVARVARGASESATLAVAANVAPSLAFTKVRGRHLHAVAPRLEHERPCARRIGRRWRHRRQGWRRGWRRGGWCTFADAISLSLAARLGGARGPVVPAVGVVVWPCKAPTWSAAAVVIPGVHLRTRPIQCLLCGHAFGVEHDRFAAGRILALVAAADFADVASAHRVRCRARLRWGRRGWGRLRRRTGPVVDGDYRRRGGVLLAAAGVSPAAVAPLVPHALTIVPAPSVCRIANAVWARFAVASPLAVVGDHRGDFLDAARSRKWRRRWRRGRGRRGRGEIWTRRIWRWRRPGRGRRGRGRRGRRWRGRRRRGRRWRGQGTGRGVFHAAPVVAVVVCLFRLAFCLGVVVAVRVLHDATAPAPGVVDVWAHSV